MFGGTLALTWGKSGGWYITRIKANKLPGSANWTRICMGRFAITHISQDLDELLDQLIKAAPVKPS